MNILTKLTCLLIFISWSFALSGQNILNQPKHILMQETLKLPQQSFRTSNIKTAIDFKARQIDINKKLQISSTANTRFLGKLDCIDTSSSFVINTDSVVLYAGNPVKTADDNLLISGLYWYFSNNAFVEKGFLLKTDTYGNVLWTQLYTSPDNEINSYINYTNVEELKDGSILLVGFINGKLIVTKTDNRGNINWSKVYNSRIWGTEAPDRYSIQQIKEDLFTGELYVTGPNRTHGYNIIKLQTNNGNIIWSKLYQPPFGSIDNNPFGIDIGATEIHSFGCFQSNFAAYINAYRINKNTGDTIQSKYYQVGNSYSAPFAFLNPDPLVKLNNGNYALSGSLWGYQHFYNEGDNAPYIQAGVVQIDSNLNFVNAFCFKNNMSIDARSQTTIYPDGSGMFRMSPAPLSNLFNAANYYIEFDNGKILRQRKADFTNQFYPLIKGWVKLNDGGNISVLTSYDSTSKANSLVFKRLHITDTASNCLGQDYYTTYTEPYQIKFLPQIYMDSIGNNVFQEDLPKKIISESFSAKQQTPACGQISFCDTFAMASSANTACLFEPFNIKITKRRFCGSPVLFNFDSSVVASFTRANDSIYTIIFKAPWKGEIYGYLNGCKLLKDSISITILNAPSILQLGADTTICPGNQIVLNAHKGYATYLWQDRSTDSVYNVKKAGTYFVTATTACGDHFSDTIIVINQPAILFNLGNDISICYKDTTTIKAPDGFINYQWSPAYNISQTNSSIVNVSPAVDTNYNVRAEKTPGCFVYDTIRVKVKLSTLVYLGNDTSICNGESKVLNAGNGFDKYLWSNGSTAQQIMANTKGDYSLIAINTAGCKSYDTVRILNVWANPVLTLDHNPVLCIGTSRILHAGKYSAYVWQDNSVLSTFVVSDTGIYYVTVTDVHQCHNSDTVKIINLSANPANFLPADTILCSYEKLVLSTNQLYSAYLWSNGYTNSSITISKAGQYWLQATNQFNCTGKDTITILPKQCLTGLYVPRAFTPNYDGKNDVFRPLIFGNVIKFEWSIYNRYGQIIFTTNNTAKGWDGTVKGTLQNSAVFVWYCRFQFAGETEQIKKGNFLLLK